MKMEDSIYVIVTGEYSDWSIIGYTKTEDEAKAVCAEHNEKAMKRSFLDTAYYIETDSCSPVRIVDTPKKRFIYCFRFMALYNGVKIIDAPKSKYQIGHEILPKLKPSIVALPDGIICVNVYLDDDDSIERAKKIALDSVYKYIAEQRTN